MMVTRLLGGKMVDEDCREGWGICRENFWLCICVFWLDFGGG